MILPLPLAGEVDALARARRVGEIFIQISTSDIWLAPPPQPSPASGRGGAAAQDPTSSTPPGGRFALAYLSRLRGRSTRSQERGGWGYRYPDVEFRLPGWHWLAPPPQPSPPSGRGGAAAQDPTSPTPPGGRS